MSNVKEDNERISYWNYGYNFLNASLNNDNFYIGIRIVRIVLDERTF